MKTNSLTSPKGDKSECKLMDSLDTAAYLSTVKKPNIILLSDKRYSLKFKRAGSDDKPKNNNNNNISNSTNNIQMDPKKSANNFKVINTTILNPNSSLSTHSHIHNSLKEKEKKFPNKISTDKQLKLTKEIPNILLASNLNIVHGNYLIFNLKNYVGPLSTKYNSKSIKKLK